MIQESEQDTQRLIQIKRNQLPLHCPMDTATAWCSHPRVFLPIDKAADQSCRCPYCGTVYQLSD